MRVAVRRHVPRPRPAVVLDERLRRAGQDAPLPPPAGRRCEARVSGAAVAVGCAMRRVRTRKGRVFATVIAIAIGIAGILLVSVAGTVAGDRALQRGVTDMEPIDRAFTVVISPDLSPTDTQLGELDHKIDGAFGRRGFGPVLRTVEYRPLAAGDGRTVRFAGIDDPRQATRLIDGKWPTHCDATECEVVALVAPSTTPKPVEPLPAGSTLGLTIVGTVESTNALVLNGELRPDPSELILLADGVGKASGLPDYSLFRRTYAWQAPIVGKELRSVDVAPLLAGVRRISTDPALSGAHVAGPEDDLLTISSRTRISANRLVVPIGALLVLFFGVAVLAGLSGRADHQRTASLLRRRGAQRSVIVVFRAFEALLPVIGGLIVGVAAGVALGGWFGSRAGLGASSILRRSIDGAVLTRVLAIGAIVWLLMFVVLSIEDPTTARRNRRVLPSDIIGVSAVIALMVLLARGSISTSSLNRVVDPTLFAVPVLAAIVLVAVVIRLVPMVVGAGAAATPRRWPVTKLTLAEATAQPLQSIATASLIAVTVMFALLTFGYASTLQLGSRDQAAFAVPYDFRLQLGPALVRPQAVRASDGWSKIVSGTTATDVLRRGVAVRQSATTVQTVELLGIDPATLDNLHGWRDGFGARPSRLGGAIDAEAQGPLGTTLPADATTIEFDGTGMAGLNTSAVIERTDGTWHEISLDEELPGGARTKLTEGDAGGQLVGFRLAQPADVSAKIEHHIGEGTTSEEARAIDVTVNSVLTTSGGSPTVVDLPVDRLRASDATVVAEPGSAVHVTGSILGTAILVTPPGPGQQRPLEAVVDPATASTARNGLITVETSSGPISVHPAAIVDRFPGAAARFAIIDIAALQPALDLLQPGAGTPNEVWLAADSGTHERALGERLSDPTFSRLLVDRRSTRQTALATDPLAVATLLILAASAVIAIVLGACALWFGAAAAATDDRPLLRTLALERVEGRRLVAMVAGKAMAAVCIALPLGLIAGRWLLQIATRLVAVSATSGLPSPPLRLDVPWLAVAVLSVVLLVILGVSAIAGSLSARRVPKEDLMRGTT